MVHGRFSGTGRPRAWIAADVCRIADGVLAEHWDVLQDEATKAESLSGLPMFGKRFADGIARNREVILFNNAGISSSSGDVPATFEEMGTNAIGFIRALGLKKVDVLGFSMGGLVAQEVTLQAPELVRRLILVGTGPRGGEGMQPMPPEAAKIFSAKYDPPEELWLAVHFSPSPSGQAAGREFLKRKHLRFKDRDPEPNDRVGPAQVAAVIRYSEGRVGKYDYLKQIKQPTLVVNGNNDVIVPTINSYHLLQNLPNAALILYPDSNHGSQYQYPELFVDQVNQFLSWGLSKPNGSQARLRFPALPPGDGVDE